MSLDFSLVIRHEVLDLNITHNLAPMAREAGVYEALWRPHEHDYTRASDILPLLIEGLELLESDPDHFKSMNPSNGWGSYEGLIDFVRHTVKVCRLYPDAFIEAHR